MASITLKGLTKSFNAGDDAPAAVAGLDLDIKDNQFITLLGPSGCGKTTTLRMIAGYIVPDAGTIHVDNRLVSSPGSVTRSPSMLWITKRDAFQILFAKLRDASSFSSNRRKSLPGAPLVASV